MLPIFLILFFVARRSAIYAPAHHFALPNSRNLALPLQMLQMCQNLKHRETVVERCQLSVPKSGDQVRGAGRSAIEQPQNSRAALCVVFACLAYPIAMAREWRSVRRQNQIDFKPLQHVERCQVITQSILLRMPADIRRNVLQNLVAGEQYAPPCSIETDVSW